MQFEVYLFRVPHSETPIRLAHHVVNAETLCRKLLEVTADIYVLRSWSAWYEHWAPELVLVQGIRGGIVGDLAWQRFQEIALRRKTS